MEKDEIIVKLDGKEAYRGTDKNPALIMFAGGISALHSTFEEELNQIDLDKSDFVKSVELIAEGKHVSYSIGIKAVKYAG